MINDKVNDSIAPSAATKTTQSPKQLNRVHRVQSPHRENEILYHDKVHIVLPLHPHNINVPAKYTKPFLNLLYNKYTLILIIILVILDNYFDVIEDNGHFWLICAMVFVDIMGVSIVIALLLSVERRIWKNVTRTFEFWFKLVYVILDYALQILSDHGESLVVMYGMLVNAVVFMVLLSVADGLYPRFRWFIAFASFASASTYAYWSILYTFFPVEVQLDIVHITDDIYFSTVNTVASIERMQAIFLYKQCFNLIFRPGHASMFGFNPILRWKSKKKQDAKRGVDLAMEMASEKKSEGPIAVQIDQDKVERANRDDRTKNDSKDSLFDSKIDYAFRDPTEPEVDNFHSDDDMSSEHSV